jgi:GntR family transcriptional regulator, transcriptional repressor for pyruvate dehydrogenase complex
MALMVSHAKAGSAPSLDLGLFAEIETRAASLDERIVDEIRRLIESGQVVPGDRLPAERDLARAFNVSRAALREAMRRLAAMGLVEIRWGKGVFIRATDLDFVLERLAPLMLGHGQIIDLYEVRRQLEVAAAGWSAERATAAERAELAALTAEAVVARGRLAEDAAYAREFDRRYHNMIAVLSHNGVVLRIMVSLLDLLGELRQRSFAIPGRALRSLEEHQQISAAIVGGEPAAARQAMLAHLLNAEAAIRSTL